MKKFAYAAVILAAFVSLGAFATRDQVLVAGAFTELKCEPLPAKDGLIGGPMRYKVTAETLELLKEGTVIIVAPNGKITVEQAAE